MKSRFSAPAKLNLALWITGRQPSGYHTLQSLMTPVSVADILDISPARDLSLTIDGPFADHAPLGADNLVLRAARAMEEAADRPAGVSIVLEKNVPAGAGLGGGSSDAAAAMRAINQAWGNLYTTDQLCKIGLSIGAEMPFCLWNRAMRVTGIGEIMEPVVLPALHVVIVWPCVKLATAGVFGVYDGRFSAMPVDDMDMNGWRNDLHDAAVSLAPVIAQGIDALKAAGASAARMTGSGSCVFGVFASEALAKKAAADVAAAYPQWWVQACRTLSSS